MSDLASIRQALSDLGISVAGEIVVSPGAPVEYIIPVRRVPAATSINYQNRLKGLTERLVWAGVNFRVVEVDEQASGIENSLRASLQSTFSNLVGFVVVSRFDQAFVAWIECLRQPSDAELNKIYVHLHRYSELFSIKFNEVNISTPGSNLPTKYQLIALIRKHAPVKLEKLTGLIADSGLTIPSSEWLNHRVDAYRRAGLLIRMKVGAYALTAEGLHAFGSNRTSRSPDISRLLALARAER